MSDAATLGPPERLHPISLLSSIAASARGMWGLFAAGGYFAIQGNWFLLIVTLVIYTVASIGAAFLRWSNFSFNVGEREIRIDSGLLSRTHRSLPFDRIQDVTIEQNPLWRALGLARVRFETGGSAGAGEDNGSLAAIPLRRAAEIRDLVRASRGITAAASPAGIEAEETLVFAMDLRRVLLAGIFNFSLAVIGGLVGLTQTIGDPIGFDPFDVDFWEGLVAPGTLLGDFVMEHRITVFIAGATVLVLVGLGAGLLRTLLRDYGFRLDRTAAGLRRRRGLFTVTDVVLPAKRTQAAVIGSGPVRSRFGWSELKLQSLAKEDGGKGDHVVAPLANDGEIANVLAAIAWQAPAEPQWRRVSRAYVGAFAVALSPLILLASVQVATFGWISSELGAADLSSAVAVSLGLLATLVGLILVRWMAWLRYAFAFDRDRLLVRSGWWQRRLKILPLRNVQSVDYLQSFIDRWFGTANIVIGVAGGGLTGHGIKALPSESARDIRDHLLSRFA
jgi:putative membrane protein